MKMNFAKKATALCNVRSVCCSDGRMREFCIYRKESRSNIRRGSARSGRLVYRPEQLGDSQASDTVNADSQMQRYNKADAIQALKTERLTVLSPIPRLAEKFVAAKR